MVVAFVVLDVVGGVVVVLAVVLVVALVPVALFEQGLPVYCMVGRRGRIEKREEKRWGRAR